MDDNLRSNPWVNEVVRVITRIRREDRMFGSLLAGWPLIAKPDGVYAPGMHGTIAIEMCLISLVEPTNDNVPPDGISP